MLNDILDKYTTFETDPPIKDETYDILKLKMGEKSR